MVSGYFDEFIGKNVNVVWSRNQTMIGKSGLVIDETKNTIKIANGRKISVIPKHIAKFKFEDQDSIIEGNLITMTPEDRIKNYNRIERKIKRLN